MMVSVGWIVLLLSLAFWKPAVLAIVSAIEADDPNNPAVIGGFHYPGAVFLYALILSPILILCAVISLSRKETARFSSLIYGVPALAVLIIFLSDNLN